MFITVIGAKNVPFMSMLYTELLVCSEKEMLPLYAKWLSCCLC